MNAPLLSISRRTRSTWWSSRVEAAGVQGYTVYNHMLLPTVFRGVEADYHHLRSAVQVWDVACERQVELRGPDADRLAQLLTVRDLRKVGVGRCAYAPVVDHEGRMINDPIAIHIGDDRWWFSIADTDIALWAGGLAAGMGLDVHVLEPDVSPLAIQGPRAEDVAALVFGDAVREIGFFRFAMLPFDGHRLAVARSGWSAQGGFEIYVDDEAIAGPLYDRIVEAGEPFDIGPGCPNLIERIEAGLLSYGNDVDRNDTALEAALDRYCALDAPIAAIGIDALRRQRESGVTRRICGLTIEGEAVPGLRRPWPLFDTEGAAIGEIRSAAWSPRLGTNVAMAMVATSHWESGSLAATRLPSGEHRSATVCELPFPGAHQR